MSCADCAAWAEAIATLLAVMVALFGDLLRQKLYPPKLRLEFLPKGEDTATTDDKREQIWWSILVTNERRYSPAKHVRVMIEGFQKRLPNERYSPELLGTPLQLHWVYPQFHEQFPNIGPKRHCNLGYLDKNERRFALSTYFVPNNFQGYVFPGETLVIRLIAVADNFASKPYFVEISWDGEWWSAEEDEKQQHVLIRPA